MRNFKYGNEVKKMKEKKDEHTFFLPSLYEKKRVRHFSVLYTISWTKTKRWMQKRFLSAKHIWFATLEIKWKYWNRIDVIVAIGRTRPHFEIDGKVMNIKLCQRHKSKSHQSLDLKIKIRYVMHNIFICLLNRHPQWIIRWHNMFHMHNTAIHNH